MARAADAEMIGRNLAGKFLVEKLLGGGAMGAVYKAYQRSIEKHVAIKVLHREFVQEATFVSRFEREAKAASLLDHVNLMRVLDYGREPDGVCYIAMELLEGRSLYQVMKEDGRLGNERLAGLLRQTLAGLAVAHEMGIVHRDLKPENIVVLEKPDDDGNRAELVKVCDFGMAKLVTPDQEKQGPLSSEKLTSHGVVVGTPDYMSPEQGRGERLDARSDLYAVGVILYQMLSGRLPFSAETPIATLLRHVLDEPVPPSELDPSVHPGLESVCLRALAKRPADRFQTAREMRAELRSVMEPRANASPSVVPPPRLALGSLPEEGFAAVDLRPPAAPRPLELGASRAQAMTPPHSHRIRAVEVLKDEAAPPRKWVGPLALGVVVALGAGTLYGYRHRRAEAVARPSPAEVSPRGPAAEAVTPPASVVANGAPASPSPSAAASSDPARAAALEAQGAMPPTYVTPPPGTVAVRGLSKPDPQATPPPVTPSAAMPAFTVLAVPEVPKIAGAHESTTPASPPPPLSAGPAAPVPPADPFEHAKVALGAVHGEKVGASDVLAALPAARFDRCYQKGLAARGSSMGGSGSLHLAIDSVGHVGSASFVGSAELASIGQCIADAAIGADVRHVEAGATGADVNLVLRPE